VAKLDHDPLGAPTHGARQMQIGRRRATARQDERPERLEIVVQPVDLRFQPRDLRRRDVQTRAARSLALIGHAEIRLDVQQVVLDARQHRIDDPLVGGVQARDADHGIRLVDRAVGLDAKIIFLATLTGSERRRAVVAGARVDAVQYDHGLIAPSRISGKGYCNGLQSGTNNGDRFMRLTAIILAAAILSPAGTTVIAPNSPAVAATRVAATEFSAANKKKPKKKPAQEQFMRAAPSGPAK